MEGLGWNYEGTYSILISRIYTRFISCCLLTSLQQRESSGENRKDFVSRLLDLKRAVIANPDAEAHRGITPGIITSQGSIFILAGYVTLIDTMQRVYYGLAKNQE